MAEPNEQPKTVSDNPQPATDKPTELPHFQSPPLSPELKAEPVRERIAPEPLEPMRPFASAPKLDPQKAEEERIFALPNMDVPKVSKGFSVPSYLQRTASLAATVLIAAGLGAAFASAMNKQPKPEPVQRDAVLIEENSQLQKSVARLTKELAALKTTVETTSKDSAARFAKLADRLDRAPETTGSISKQAVVAPPPAPPAAMPSAEPPPLPPARPAGAQLEQRRPLPIIQGWTIYQVRNGVAWVDNGGELFAAQVGVPLPGLGPVEAVRREGSQWIVITPRGVISSAGESTAANARPKPYYPPYYRAR